MFDEPPWFPPPVWPVLKPPTGPVPIGPTPVWPVLVWPVPIWPEPVGKRTEVNSCIVHSTHCFALRFHQKNGNPPLSLTLCTGTDTYLWSLIGTRGLSIRDFSFLLTFTDLISIVYNNSARTWALSTSVTRECTCCRCFRYTLWQSVLNPPQTSTTYL